MLIEMGRDQTADEIFELRAEAAAARDFAATFDDGPSVTDLLNYADALDREADELELVPGPENVGTLSSPAMRFDIAVQTTASEPLTRARFR